MFKRKHDKPQTNTQPTCNDLWLPIPKTFAEKWKMYTKIYVCLFVYATMY